MPWSLQVEAWKADGDLVVCVTVALMQGIMEQGIGCLVSFFHPIPLNAKYTSYQEVFCTTCPQRMEDLTTVPNTALCTIMVNKV